MPSTAVTTPSVTMRTTRSIAAVSEDLAGGAQSRLFGGKQHFASAERQKGETVVHFADALDDGARQLFILCRHVVERAVWLDVVHLHARGTAESFQRAELILNVGFRFGGGDVHAAAAKAHQIGETGVRADMHAGLAAARDGFRHHERIARVVAAGDVGGGNQRDDGFIHADGICAEAFAEVTVQVNRNHTYKPFFGALPQPPAGT